MKKNRIPSCPTCGASAGSDWYLRRAVHIGVLCKSCGNIYEVEPPKEGDDIFLDENAPQKAIDLTDVLFGTDQEKEQIDDFDESNQPTIQDPELVARAAKVEEEIASEKALALQVALKNREPRGKSFLARFKSKGAITAYISCGILMAVLLLGHLLWLRELLPWDDDTLVNRVVKNSVQPLISKTTGIQFSGRNNIKDLKLVSTEMQQFGEERSQIKIRLMNSSTTPQGVTLDRDQPNRYSR